MLVWRTLSWCLSTKIPTNKNIIRSSNIKPLIFIFVSSIINNTQEGVDNEDIDTNITSDYLFSLTKVMEQDKLKDVGYIFKGKFAYLPEVYNKFTLDKLDSKAIDEQSELIEDLLDKLDRENLVKEIFYNVCGSKYVSARELNNLLSDHFFKMKSLKAQIDFPFSKGDITGISANQFLIMDEELALVRGFSSEKPSQDPMLEANKESHVKGL
jgi:hypothetical protein